MSAMFGRKKGLGGSLLSGKGSETPAIYSGNKRV